MQRRLPVPDGDDEVGAEEDQHLAELDLLLLLDVPGGLEDDEQRLVVDLELRPLVSRDGVLDREVVQGELAADGLELLVVGSYSPSQTKALSRRLASTAPARLELPRLRQPSS